MRTPTTPTTRQEALFMTIADLNDADNTLVVIQSDKGRR